MMTEQQQLAAKDQQIKIKQAADIITKEKQLSIGFFGKAGVGKTHCAKELSVLLRDNDPFIINVYGVTVSHNAKRILQKSLGDDIECFTLASFLQLERKFDDNGKEYFEPAKKTRFNVKTRRMEEIPPPIKNADMIIIDECSQIPQWQKDLIDKLKRKWCVIVYLGDWHQTPPVEENTEDLSNVIKDSPTFDVPHVLLTTPFRYEGVIQLLADDIAKEIDKNEHGFGFIKPYINTHKEITIYKDEVQFLKDYIDRRKTSTNVKDVTLINYRNQVVKDIGTNVRSSITNGSREKYCIDDILICKKSYYVDSTCILANYAIVKVKAINSIKTKVYFGSNMIVDITPYNIKNMPYLGFSSKNDIEYKEIISLEIEHKELILETDEGKELYIPVIDKADANYTLIENILLSRAKDKHNKEVTWETYYNFLEHFGTFEYAYAVNTYTVQGDTYNEVFVNLRDINSVKPITTRQKLQSFYTAVTRARNKVNILL